MNLESAADKFIHTSLYFKHLRSQGQLHFTGSYFLKTMTWADLDVQLVLETKQQPMESIGFLVSQLLLNNTHKKIDIRDCVHHPRKGMPAGFYLSVEHYDPQIEGYWKIDSWILQPDDFQRNRKLMEQVKKDMTLEQHALIMDIKRDWVRRYHRSPKAGSHFLYQAVVLEGLTQRPAIDAYLCAHGVVEP